MILILDADKEGFLRSTRSLIQTIGRAARNANGHVIMFADNVTDSMHEAITETYRRRQIQEKYNLDHNITPKTITKEISESITIFDDNTNDENIFLDSDKIKEMSTIEKRKIIAELEEKMRKAAKDLNFEEAMVLRDAILEIKTTL